jgi:hypothetical protein
MKDVHMLYKYATYGYASITLYQLRDGLRRGEVARLCAIAAAAMPFREVGGALNEKLKTGVACT